MANSDHIKLVPDDGSAFQAPASTSSKDDPVLQQGDGGGTLSGMDILGLHTRLSRLEGGNTTLQWSVGIVSAAMLAAGAIIVGLQFFTLSRVDSVEQKVVSVDQKVGSLESQVQALPAQINQNLLELNRTLSTAITAAQGRPAPVIVYPEVVPKQENIIPKPDKSPPPKE